MGTTKSTRVPEYERRLMYYNVFSTLLYYDLKYHDTIIWGFL